MSLWEVALIGVSLAMDAFAVSVCRGLQMRGRINWRHLLIIALFFGGLQALMPAIGYFLGKQFEQYISAFDFWIAFALLVFLGGKMIVDAIREGMVPAAEEKECTCACGADKLDLRQLTLMAIATSIDALTVGISFATYQVSLALSVTIIGLLTFVICAVGVIIGHLFGARYKNIATLAGGLVLIGMGIKFLVEGLLA